MILSFNDHSGAVGMAVPYYHRLTGDAEANRAILHYEVYMRNYNINLWRIKSPYAFTALGSAMAVPLWAYKAIGGMTPKKSGEDFYFLQKLRKYGSLICWNKEKVYPEARFSDRVFFGTGPAMIKGRAGDWDSYPVYAYQLFDRIKETCDKFESLFTEDIQTPMDEFLTARFDDENIWKPLRKNSTVPEQFARACHNKVDGLRILQFLKQSQASSESTDEDNLMDFLGRYYPDESRDLVPEGKLSFNESDLMLLNNIRNFLVDKEEQYQKSKILLSHEQ
jgi:hypothetical protein